MWHYILFRKNICLNKLEECSYYISFVRNLYNCVIIVEVLFYYQLVVYIELMYN